VRTRDLTLPAALVVAAISLGACQGPYYQTVQPAAYEPAAYGYDARYYYNYGYADTYGPTYRYRVQYRVVPYVEPVPYLGPNYGVRSYGCYY
jgi:hypothetical protein